MTERDIWFELWSVERRLEEGDTFGQSTHRDVFARPLDPWGIGDLGQGRVRRVREALEHSGPIALRLLGATLQGIGLSSVWDILATCKDVAKYYGGSVLAGTAIGGVVGTLFGGVGALPGAALGAAAGAQAGAWLLALLGLKALVTGLASASRGRALL